jgi:hypothetical protein
MKIFLACCLLLISYYLPAQEVKLSFNKQRILLGEQLLMKMEATIRSGQDLSSFSIDTLPHFEVLDRSGIDTTIAGGNLRLSQTVTITSWDSGRWSLPSLIINSTPSKPIAIDVGYTSPWDSKKPYNDIKGIVPVKRPEKNNWWWYVIGAAVLVALFLLFFPQGKKEEGISTMDAGAYKKAMQAMDKLQKEGTASANAKYYYTELTTIFRTYLKGAKGIQSFSKTTDDLGIQLQSLKIPSPAYNELLQTLRLSDLVKFAQYVPDSEAMNSSFSTMKQSITTIEQSHAV